MGFLEDDMFDFSRHPAGRTPSYYHDKHAGNIFYGITDGAGPWNGFAHYPNGAVFTNTKFAKRTSFLGEFNVNCLNEPYNGKVYVANKKGYSLRKGTREGAFDDSLEAQTGGRRLQELTGHSTISRLLREERRSAECNRLI